MPKFEWLMEDENEEPMALTLHHLPGVSIGIAFPSQTDETGVVAPA